MLHPLWSAGPNVKLQEQHCKTEPVPEYAATLTVRLIHIHYVCKCTQQHKIYPVTQYLLFQCAGWRVKGRWWKGGSEGGSLGGRVGGREPGRVGGWKGERTSKESASPVQTSCLRTIECGRRKVESRRETRKESQQCGCSVQLAGIFDLEICLQAFTPGQHSAIAQSRSQ